MGETALDLAKQGRFSQAIPLWKQLEQWQHEHLGAADPRRLLSLRNLASLYLAVGLPREAAETFRRHLEQLETLKESTPLQIAMASLDLAKALRTLARFDEARSLVQKVLHLLDGQPASTELTIARASAHEVLGVIAHEQGFYPLAEQDHRQALRLRQSIANLNDLSVANSTANVAQAALRQGRFADALELERQALALYRLQPDRDSRGQRATVLANLGLTLDLLGHRSEAITAMQQALQLRLSLSGRRHPETARLLLNLGALEVVAGDVDVGLSRYREGLAVLEERMGVNHISTAFAIQRMAELARDLGQVAKAQLWYERVLKIRRQQLRPDHPDIATSLIGLALNELQQQRRDKAVAHLQEALAIRTSAFGPSHPYTANTLLLLGLLDWEQSAGSDRFQRLRSAAAAYVRFLQGEAALLPISERRQLIATVQESRNVFYGLALQGDSGKDLALETRLNLQGLLEELERRQALLLRRNPSLQADLASLSRLAAQLAATDVDGLSQEQLRQRRDGLERSLYRQLVHGQQTAGWISSQTIARAMPADGVLVEFLRVDPVRFSGGSLNSSGAGRYAALILQHDGRSKAVDLGLAETINQAIWQALLQTQRAEPGADQAWSRVSSLVIQPLLADIGTRRRWFLSPDGELHRLPFAVLGTMKAGVLQPYADRHRLHLLTSARDLLASQTHNQGPPSTPPLVLADPDFDAPAKRRAGSAEAALERGQPLPDAWRDLRWNRLPGSRDEGSAIGSILGGRLLFGTEARVGVLLEAAAPRVLHVASHGAFLAKPVGSLEPQPNSRMQSLEGKARVDSDPMLRSVVILAGANRRQSASQDDGWLTALELSKLNLQGTRLVTLSACDTGKGGIEVGDGIYGLRRGISVAGATSSLLSLWKVNDQATSALMQAFYGNLRRGFSPEESLRKAQMMLRRHRRADWQHPYYWAAFQLYGRSWSCATGTGPEACQLSQ